MGEEGQQGTSASKNALPKLTPCILQFCNISEKYLFSLPVTPPPYNHKNWLVTINMRNIHCGHTGLPGNVHKIKTEIYFTEELTVYINFTEELMVYTNYRKINYT